MLTTDLITMSPDVPQQTEPFIKMRGESVNVIIEMKSNPGFGMDSNRESAKNLEKIFSALSIDADFDLVPVKPYIINEAGFSLLDGIDNYLVKATVPRQDIPNIETMENVVKVWNDTLIQPFPCPIPPCDCTPSTPKGNISTVANFLGVDKIWKSFQGAGIVVAVVDGGITAATRPVGPGETTKRITNVTGGWPADWGTTAKLWNEHGNMCATDVLGMAPQSHLYDIRISGGGLTPPGSGFISNAIAGFQWCINRFREDGTPQIITNSWGLYQASIDPFYATNPAHPFTRKVEEALNAGILVLFAAGNCGDTCPATGCGTDVGSGRSIWGANGHPRVMTVGAVNTKGEFVGYSSQGPAALDPRKPDFCSATHFTGYFPSDTGTSAATPIAAGVVALIKQAKPAATQVDIKNAIMSTALDIGPVGWDIHSGAGILQAELALNSLP
ncbi:MAG TPA: S8 family serine peptidase [Chitinophagaceae bacterium]|jgi:subtilisin family serine protease|nr:S8 family serine peptidase [Chitinophagaceae bacterium]